MFDQHNEKDFHGVIVRMFRGQEHLQSWKLHVPVCVSEMDYSVEC